MPVRKLIFTPPPFKLRSDPLQCIMQFTEMCTLPDHEVINHNAGIMLATDPSKPQVFFSTYI